MGMNFAEMHPELASEFSERNLPLMASDITYGSNKKYWWSGKCGHEWLASPKSRHSGEGCPYCAGMRVLEGFNDLASVRLELVDEWSSEIEPLCSTLISEKTRSLTVSEKRKNRAGPAMTGSEKTICTFVMSSVSRYNEVRKQMEVLEMSRHKAEKRIVELGFEQLRLAKRALLEFRNKLLTQGKPTEDVNELLLKNMK